MRQKPRLWRRILFGLSLIVLAAMIFTGVPILKYMVEGAKEEESLIAVRESYYDKKTSEEDKVDDLVEAESEAYAEADYMGQYESLLEINEDMVGWITIPGTNIDYPVVQAQDNVYYLGRNILNRYSDRGAIFLDYRNMGNGTDKNTVIYGHNMYDGSMFARLYKLKDEKYYETHKLITLNLKGTYSVWEIFAVYITNDNPVRTSFSSDYDFEQYLKIIEGKKMYVTDAVAEVSDQILTLSTCTNVEHDGRLVVHARKRE